jgi:GNAT superfamily N-acetyltransferase
VEWDVLGADTWAAAFVAEAGGKPVGCALAGRHYRAAFGERCLDLGSLVVEPAWRGRGVGRALVAAVLRRAEELACSRVMVGTTTGNTSAQRFYQRLGFEPLPGPRYRMLISPELRPA